MPDFPLVECLERLARRDLRRTEADIQADVRDLLLYGRLNLAEDQLVLLEAPVGAQRRIDVEAGFSVFEVKKDLRNARIKESAVDQLAGYVSDRSSATGQRYVGILTDGAEWNLYHLVGTQLEPVSTFEVDPAHPDVDGLRLWLDGVLATTEAIAPTPAEIERRLGATSSAYELDAAELAALYRAHGDVPAVKLKRELWAKLLRTAFGTSFKDEAGLFVSHTLLVAMADIVGHAVIGIDVTDPSVSPATLLSGALFAQAQIGGVVEADFFDWPLEVPGGERFVAGLARRLSRFAWAEVEHDVMKVLYESVISADQRHRLGEYYTPNWLAQEIVDAVVEEPLSTRVLDPSCGSGTFLFWALRRILDAAERAGIPNARGPDRLQQRFRAGRAPGGGDVGPGDLPARHWAGTPLGARPPADIGTRLPRRLDRLGCERGDAIQLRCAHRADRRRGATVRRRAAIPGPTARRCGPLRPPRRRAVGPGNRQATRFAGTLAHLGVPTLCN